MTLVFAATSFAQNLISNGSFETGTTGNFAIGTTANTTAVPGWSALTSSGASSLSYNSGAPSIGYPNAVDGSRYLAVHSGNSTAGVSRIFQDFSTVVGLTYRVSFSMGSMGQAVSDTAPRTGTVSIRGEAFNVVSGAAQGGALGQVTAAMNAPFRTFLPTTGFTFVATGATSRVQFSDLSTVTDGVDLALDNVQVTAFPSTTGYAFTTLAGVAGSQGSADGAGSTARFKTAEGVAVDSGGNVFVADTSNQTVRKITPGGVVTTLAGTAGIIGSADGTGGAAQFHNLIGVAVDGSGNVFVTDTDNHTIRKITAGGVVTTFAGVAGNPGGGDGTGSAARFNHPLGIAVDGAGNLFVADNLNSTIRKITSGGVVTTLAGAAGSTGSADGTGGAARFNGPYGVAVDGSGNLYVGDYGSSTVRKITAAGVVTTLAGAAGSIGSADGTGSAARFNGIAGVAVDGNGNLFVADINNSTIRKVTAGGVVTTLGGLAGSFGSADGTGSAAQFSRPVGVAVDGSGNVYIADYENSTIRKGFTTAVPILPSYTFTTLAGVAGSIGSTDGTGSAALFSSYPLGVAVDSSGTVYVADTGNYTIRKITAGAVVTTLAGTAGSKGSADGTGGAARFNDPYGVAVDGSGNVYVTDTYNDTIRKITPAGVVTTLAGAVGIVGSADGASSAARFNIPSGVAVDGGGNIFVADTYNHTIRKIASSGAVTTLAGVAGSIGSADGTGSGARFNYPVGLAIDGSGNLFVGDSNNHTIRKITSGGVVSTVAGAAGSAGIADGIGSAARFDHPEGVSVDGSGNVYVVEVNNHTVRKITAAGVVTTVSGLPGTSGSADGTGSAARFNQPYGIAVDGGGNLFVADQTNHTIRKGAPTIVPILTGYTFTTLAGSAGSSGSVDGTGSAARFNQPYGVAIDGSGNVFVPDFRNHTIRKINASGSVTTLAGLAGSVGSADGTGSAARFNFPHGIAADSNGNVFVTDGDNSTIRKITPAGIVTTFAGQAALTGSADGTGSAARFNVPLGVTVDSSGTVFVADTSNETIRRITAAGVVTTVAGAVGIQGSADGAGSAARFFSPYGVAVDEIGNLFIADTWNDTIRKITTSGVVTTVAGTAGSIGSTDGTGGTARFNLPRGLAVDSGGNVFVSDTSNQTIRKITSGGVVTTLAGAVGASGSVDGTGAVARFNAPIGVAVDGSGNVFVADVNNHTIRKGVPALALGVPAIAALTPTVAVAGANIVINGINLSGTSVVRFAGLAANFTVNSDMQITAQVPVGAAYGPVTVQRGDGLSAQSAANFAPTFSGGGNIGLGSLAPKFDLALGPQPYTATTADIDGDGKLDVIALLHNSGTGLAVLRNISTGAGIAFAPVVTFPTLLKGLTPVAADLDGDGKLDIAMVNYDSGTFSVFRNTSTSGAISFAARVDITTGGLPYGLVVGDIDGDGMPDVIVNDSATAKLWVFRNLSTPGTLSGASFAPKVEFTIGSTDARYPSIGDLDGDGKLDIVTANSVAGTISILRNASTPGTIAFDAKLDLAVAANPVLSAILIGDLDGDGKPDLAVNVGGIAGNISLFRNQSTPGSLTAGSFAPKVEIPAGVNVQIMLLADLNGDGKSDLVLTNRPASGGKLTLLQNMAASGSLTAASFAAPVDFPVDAPYTYVPVVGDFDGDGRADVIVTHDQNTGYAAVFRNTHTAGNASLPQVLLVSHIASSVTGAGYISAYSTSGAPLNTSFITGLTKPYGLAADSSGNIWVSDGPAIKKYTAGGQFILSVALDRIVFRLTCDASGNVYAATGATSGSGIGTSSVVKISSGGAILNASLITGFDLPLDLAVGSNGNLYVSNALNGLNPLGRFASTVGIYTLAGAPISPALIPGLWDPTSFAMDSSNNLFVGLAHAAGNYGIYKYSATTGAAITVPMVTGLTNTAGLVVVGNILYQVDYFADYSGSVSAYSTNGDLINRSLITSGATTLPFSIIAVNSLPPAITTQPVAQTANLNGSVTFSVAATGTPAPTFQWRKNGTAIAGATNAALTLTNVQTGDAGSYDVVMTNAGGSVTSNAVALAINTPPVITAISAPRQVVNLGQSLTLSITATGATSYQWKRNGLPIAGATATNYVITTAASRDNGYYQATATNAVGSTTSAVVFVNVAINPAQVLALGTSNYLGVLTIPAGLTDVAAISGGFYHNLALKSDGTVVAWGDNQSGQTTIPTGLSGVVAIATGDQHSTVLKSDGTVVAWGDNQYGQATVPVGLNGVVAIASGGSHSVALRSDGTVVAWGYNLHGQSTIPTGLNGVVAIACGKHHSLALKSDGTLVAWGYNVFGQATVPAGLSGVVAMAAGLDHSMALKSDGTVVAWGTNSSGLTAVPAGLTGVVAVAAGSYHSLALKSDGTLVAWGDNGTGQSTVPLSLTSAVAIAGGTFHSLLLRSAAGDPLPVISAISAPRQVVTLGQSLTLSATVTGANTILWKRNGLPIPGATSASYTIASAAARDNGYYQMFASNAPGTTASAVMFVNVAVNPGQVVALGTDNNFGVLTIPAGLTDVAAIAGDFNHNLALKSDGTVVAWGDNQFGQAAIPAGLSGVVAIATGLEHSLALKSDGTVVAWGANQNGQQFGQTTVPAGLSGVVAIACGNYHCLALKSDGTLVAWGYNPYGQTTIPAGLAGVVAITSGNAHNLALKSDGTVVVWGYNSFGQSTVPAGLTGVVAIAAGIDHSLALKSDGTVNAWGTNSSGQTAIPAGLAGVVTIAGGVYQSLALKSDGTVVAWGDNTWGESTVPAGMSSVVAIASGRQHSLILRSTAGDVVPTITTQPQSQTVASGANVTFTVTANGTPAPTFQWKKNGADIVGATGASLTLTGVGPINAGTYSVVVANSAGAVTSAGAVLSGLGTPITTSTPTGTWTAANSPYVVTSNVTITNLVIQPGVTVLLGDSVEFRVTGLLTAAGTAPSPITFKRLTTGIPWTGIVFANASPTCQFDFCIVEGAMNTGLTLTGINGLGAGQITIRDSIFRSNAGLEGGGLFSAVNLTLERCQFLNNSITGIQPRGAGVCFRGTALTVTSCTFTNNSATSFRVTNPQQHSPQGGGLFAGPSGTVQITGSEFRGNRLEGADCRGAGIAAAGPTLTIINSTIADQVSNGLGGSDDSARNTAYGGGVYSDALVVISDSTVTNNTIHSQVGSWGAGLYGQTEVRALRTRFQGNNVGCRDGNAHGGAISGGSGQFQNCVFVSNVATAAEIAGRNGLGGAVNVRTGTFAATNCIFSANSVAGGNPPVGGAIYHESGLTSATIVNCTIYGNTPSALYAYNGTIRNSILYGSTAFALSSPSVSYSLIQGGYTGTGNLDTNPLFVDTTNFLLATNSPAVDAGDPAAAYFDVAFPPARGASRNDMGAYGGPTPLKANDFGAPLVLFNSQPSPPLTLAPATPIQVTISTSFAGGHIYYTLDGSDPNAGAVYTAPLSVTPPATIRAIAYDAAEANAATIASINLSYYALAATTAGGGTLAASPAGGPFLANSVVNLTATADSGWAFSQWMGDGSGASPTLAVTMDRAKAVQAVFATPVTFSVPAGGGTVTAEPATGPYGYGSVARVSAVPSAGNYWIRWGGAANGLTGNPLAFTVTAPNATVSAVFGTLPANSFSLTALTSGSGTVAAVPGPTSGYYASGTAVMLTATPGSGQVFAGWTGAVTSSLNPLSLTMDASKVVTANFAAPAAPVITTQPQSQTATVGGNVTITVVASGSPVPAYQWRKNGTNIAGATNAALSLNSVQTSDAGSYSVVVTNYSGTVTSNAATLTVNAGVVVAWGRNVEGQTTVPVGLAGVVAIAAAAGANHTVALKGDGTVVAWGDNTYGQTTVPVGLNGVVAIATGLANTVAIKSDSTLVVWGTNAQGQLNVPVQAQSGVKAAAVGNLHLVALRSDGTVVAWGFNGYGQASVPGGLAGVTAIGAGSDHTVALKTDGAVVAWGLDNGGQATPPVAAQSGVKAIAVGASHTLALKNDGTVVAWGSNAVGQAAVPSGLIGVVAIAAGGNVSMALKSDGTVAVWGSNDQGQSTVPAGLNGVTAIAAGGAHAVALLGTGSVAPAITTPPASQTVAVGQSITFTVATTGTPLPTYQWRKGANNIAGATNASYAIASAQLGDAGSYDVVITNSAGTVTSNAATLTVVTPPTLAIVSVQRRAGTKLVEITYDLGHPQSLPSTITVEVSQDGGATWLAAPLTLTGAVGANIAPGTAKLVTWNAGLDWPAQSFSQVRIRITADDGQGGGGAPSGFAVIPAGTFTMGDGKGEGGANELPTHSVTLSAFYLQKTEATYAQWREIYDWNASGSRGYDLGAGQRGAAGVSPYGALADTAANNTHPVTQVSWLDIVKWCNAKSRKDGLTPCYYSDSGFGTELKSGTPPTVFVNWSANGYRLPTEAEWEFAARGGLTGKSYPWGDGITGSQANYPSSGDPFGGTSPVGYYDGNQTPAGGDMKNGYGLYDMAGNVWEWSWDWFGNYSSLAQVDPRGPASGSVRVVRGGSWFTVPLDLRCALRAWDTQGWSDSTIGFRPARSSVAVANSIQTSSAAFTLQLADPPVITTPPATLTVIVGQPATFTVAATGTAPFTYQWRKATVAIGGATSATYTIASAQLGDAGSYDVVVTNPAGNVSSTAATLTVNPPTFAPSITTQPVNQVVSVGQTATFTVVATGGPAPGYQWRKAGVNISGATSATYTIVSAQVGDAGTYSVVVSNGIAPDATSQNATLTVNVPPIFSTQPAGTTIGTGSTATLTFAVAGTGPLTYQWYQGASGVTSTPIGGATGLSYTTPALAVSTDYWVRVTGPGGTVDSATASVTVASYAPGVAFLTDGPVQYLTTGGPVTLRVRITYTGQTPSALGIFVNIPAGWTLASTGGPNVPQVAPLAGTTNVLEWGYSSFPTNQAEFTFVVSAPAGQSGPKPLTGYVNYRPGNVNVTLPALTLAGITPLVITTQPRALQVDLGQPATFSAAATGDPAPSYQWRKDNVIIPGATGAVMTIAAAAMGDGGYYDVVVTNGVASPVYSDQVLLKVIPTGTTATHLVVGGGYTGLTKVTISNTITYPGTATALGWQVLLPAGWSFDSDGGSAGESKPPINTTGSLEWAWTTIPPSPVTFTYTLNKPAGATGDIQIAAFAIVRLQTLDWALQLLAKPDPLVLKPVLHHSADRDTNFRISLVELTRVIELYNTRSGTTRTGRYKVQAGTEDGFTLDLDSATNQVLANYHSADSNRNGALSLLELTRVIELYNFRSGTTRTGQYHAVVPPALPTEDGYAPGP